MCVWRRGGGRVGCVLNQSDSGYWSVVSVFLISEHSICKTNDSRKGGMPFSFMCACAKFVI